MNRLMPLALGLLLSAAGLPAVAQSSSGGQVMEPAAQPSASPRATPITEDVTSPRQPYAFVPIGANVYDDVFLQNFVDLDAPADLLDFTGGNFTLPGGTGEDVVLRSFAEQDLGVPVFAALDGTASQAVYADSNDHNTTGTSSGLGNYVILDHGAGQQTGYFSLVYSNPSSPDTRYAQVSVGETVRAGTQIGLAGSSGASTSPHFHLQSSLNGTIYEPFAGPARPGPSWWTAQPIVRKDTYLEVFNVDAGNVVSPAPDSDLPRQGTFVQGTTNTGGWTILHNLPANSTFRLRWLRPDGTVYHDTSGNFTFNGSNAFQRTVEYYWNYTWNPGLDQAGTWHLELTVNGSLVQAAPFFVVASASQDAHHAPYTVTATLDPVQPTASDAIFCRVATAPGQDGAPVVVSPDSALVFYRYQWFVSGPGPGGPTLVRDATTAGHADAIPWGQANVGSTVQCLVTPMDGTLAGTTSTVSATLASRTSAGIAVGPNNTPRLLWDNPAGVASLWTINPDGSHTYTTYGPYTDNAPQNKWAPAAISVGPDNGVHLLWDNTDGRAAFWSFGSDGTPTVTGYGPYSDNGAGNLWSATAVATGPNGVSRMLWNNTDGRVALWSVDGQGDVLNVTGYGPYTDNAPQNKWSAVGVSVGTDNVTHLLWSNTDGRMAFWSVDGQGNVLSVTGYGPYTDNGAGNLWNATSIATGANGISRVLWNNTDGRVALWNLDGQGNLLSLTGYGPYAGFTANAVGVGANNNSRIVWTGTNGQTVVWNIDTSGNVTLSAYGL